MSETQKSRKQAEQQEAIDRLRKILKPGDRVYGIVRTVSRSGMSRTIDFLTFQQRDTKCGYPGCGEDVGYHLHSSAEDCPGCLAPRDHHAFRPGEPCGPIDHVYLSGWIATALDCRRDKSGALKVQGCGQDMIFHVVYNLGWKLFPEGFGLPCEHCGRRPDSKAQADARRAPAEWLLKGAIVRHGCEFWGRNGDRSGWDTDGGYALKAETL